MEIDNTSEVPSEQGSKKSWWSRSRTPKEPKESKPGVFDRKSTALTLEQVRERDRLVRQQAAENPSTHAMYVQQMHARGVAVQSDYDRFRVEQERAVHNQQLHHALATTQVLRDPPSLPAQVPMAPQQYSAPPSPQSSVTQVAPPQSPQQEQKHSFFGKKKDPPPPKPAAPQTHTLAEVQAADKYVQEHFGELPASQPHYETQRPISAINEIINQPGVGRGLRAYGPDGAELFPPKNQQPPQAAEGLYEVRQERRKSRHSGRYRSSKYSGKKGRGYRYDLDSDSDSLSDSSTDSSVSSSSASSSSSEELAPPWESSSAYKRFPRPRPVPRVVPRRFTYLEEDVPVFTRTPSRSRHYDAEMEYAAEYYPRQPEPRYGPAQPTWEEYPEEAFYDDPRGYPPRSPFAAPGQPRRSITDPGVAFVDEVVPAPYIETSPQWGREGRSFQ